MAAAARSVCSTSAPNAHIVDVVLNGEPLDPAGGELVCPQIGEVAALHQTVRARLDDFLD
jgi:hypothetical protein